MKRITMEEAVNTAWEGDKNVFLMLRIDTQTMLEDLATADGFCVEDPQKEPEKPKKKYNRIDHGEQKRPKTVDHGKIIACHRAGWSIAKIADEIGCSEQTVRKHIEKEKA